MNNPPRRRASLWIGAVSLAVLAAVASVLFGAQPTKADSPSAAAEPAALPVPVATVVEASVAGWSEFSGRLEAVERVELRSRVAGTVQSVHFREGSLVRRGDLLVTIDPAPYAAEVERYEAEALAAQARLAHAGSELDRARRLWDEQAIAQREFDERAHAQREAAARLRAAQAALRSAKLDLSWTQVRAPVEGRVGRLEVTTGNLVAAGPGAPVLTTLVSVSPIYASFEADEPVVARALADLRGLGGQARLDRVPVQLWTQAMPAGGAPLEGRLQLVDNQVDAASGTIRVRAQFDNPGGALMPGQFARLRMGQPKAQPAVLINERAVGTDQSKRFVIVVDAADKAVWREVTLGAPFDGLRVVTSGLVPGERVVVSGLHRVRPGALIAPQVVAMDAKPEVRAAQARDGAQS